MTYNDDYENYVHVEVYLDGVHARVGLHPLDTVLSLVWRQFPELSRIISNSLVLVIHQQFVRVGHHHDACPPDWNAFIRFNHPFIHTGSSAVDKLQPSILAQITSPLTPRLRNYSHTDPT